MNPLSTLDNHWFHGAPTSLRSSPSNPMASIESSMPLHDTSAGGMVFWHFRCSKNSPLLQQRGVSSWQISSAAHISCTKSILHSCVGQEGSEGQPKPRTTLEAIDKQTSSRTNRIVLLTSKPPDKFSELDYIKLFERLPNSTLQ